MLPSTLGASFCFIFIKLHECWGCLASSRISSYREGSRCAGLRLFLLGSSSMTLSAELNRLPGHV